MESQEFISTLSNLQSPVRAPIGSWKKFPQTKTKRHNTRKNSSPSSSKSLTNSRWSSPKHHPPKSPFIPASVGRLKFSIHRNFDCFGLRRRLEKSFEINQSFPSAILSKNIRKKCDVELMTNNNETPPLSTSARLSQLEIGMDKIRVDGANGLRFSARRKGGFITPVGAGSPFSGSFVTSASESLLRVPPQTGINPNKAVFTIDSKTSQILIVNRNACELLGFTPRELCDMQFSSLLTNKNKSHVSALAEGQLNSEDGTIVLLSGKVVEMNTKYTTKVAVSLWIRQIDADGRCLAVAEPVERRVAQIIVDRNGTIFSGDYEALMLFQLESLEHFCGMDIQTLIPAIQLPDADSSLIEKHVRKQKATGKTSDGISFPLCLLISLQDIGGTDSTDSGVSNNSSSLYVITIWVFQNISGLLVIDEHGIIESCNHHFSMLMFGYAQSKMLGMLITNLIPNFSQEIEYLGCPRSRNATTSSLDNDDDESETETDPVYIENDGYVNNTMSEFSQSFGGAAASMDLSKAISEPVNICLDFTHSGKFADVTATALVDQTNTDNVATTISKSMSENILMFENLENNRNIPNLHNLHNSEIKSSDCILFSKEMDLCNFKSNPDLCDMDLLTPVNDDQPLSTFSSSSAADFNALSQHLPPPTTSMSMIGSMYQHNQSSTDQLSERSLKSEPINIKSTSHTYTPPSQAAGPSRYGTPKFIRNLNLDAMHNKQLTSTPTNIKRLSTFLPNSPTIFSAAPQCHLGQFIDGKYKGEAIHCDENILDILYTISSQTLPCGRKVFCVWICRDPDIDYGGGDDVDDDDLDGKHQNLTLTFNSLTSTVDNSLGQAIKTTAAQNSSRPNSVSLLSQCEDDQITGEFNNHYTTLKQIGKGAYGYVKMAFRHTDRLLVVTKFILKDKLMPQLMILADDGKNIPMEIYLLKTVKHPNIVSVFDVFENEKFFQLVMEKHGSGMDLFEFIDRRPTMDEKLGCFIFRQIANAVDYLHSLHILHRDIKDENIIIDQNFHVKLIDFGSATFMEEGRQFSTFYGTTEYCSPEVLAGNKYAGPELEMWSLGVTLYVLLFFENPFLDIEETLHNELTIPHFVSTPLQNLLFQMLDKNPKTRCTMKQLLLNPWICQDLNPSLFKFTSIVPCESFEANPEKYFTGQIYSSATGLSTTSPQDSLSLVDDNDDSLIDGDDGDDDDDDDDNNDDGIGDEGDEEDDDKSLPSQDDQSCDKYVDLSNDLSSKSSCCSKNLQTSSSSSLTKPTTIKPAIENCSNEQKQESNADELNVSNARGVTQTATTE